MNDHSTIFVFLAVAIAICFWVTFWFGQDLNDPQKRMDRIAGTFLENVRPLGRFAYEGILAGDRVVIRPQLKGNGRFIIQKCSKIRESFKSNGACLNSWFFDIAPLIGPGKVIEISKKFRLTADTANLELSEGQVNSLRRLSELDTFERIINDNRVEEANGGFKIVMRERLSKQPEDEGKAVACIVSALQVF